MKRSYKRWSRDEVIRVIRQLSERGEPLNLGRVSRTWPALAYAGRRYVGSWEKAIEAAGLDYSTVRRKNFWTRAAVLTQIRVLHAAGEPLNVSHAEVRHGGLVRAASAYLGSWRAAIEAAGFDYLKIKRQREWSKAAVVTEIRRMRRAGMRLATTREVRQRFRVLHAAAIRYFGSWAAAVKAAGLGRFLTR